MPESDRPQAASLREGARTAVPISPRVADEPRSFSDAPQTYTFIEEHRAPAPREEDRVSRR